MKKVPNCSIHNSITMLGRDKVLLGRCWGLSPQLKSVEFSFLPNVVHELQSIVCVKPLKKVLHFMGSGPNAHPSGAGNDWWAGPRTALPHVVTLS